MHAWCTAQCCTSIMLYKSQVKEQSTWDWKNHKSSSCHLYTNSGAQVLTRAHILAVRQHIHKYHPFICYTWNAMQICWELKTAFRVGWSLVNLPTALWSCDSTTTKFQADICKRQCFSQLPVWTASSQSHAPDLPLRDQHEALPCSEGLSSTNNVKRENHQQSTYSQ